jgi:hypothetical protein
LGQAIGQRPQPLHSRLLITGKGSLLVELAIISPFYPDQKKAGYFQTSEKPAWKIRPCFYVEVIQLFISREIFNGAEKA